VYIFCMTKSITDWMWENYAGTQEQPATGACLLLGFEEFNNTDQELWQPLYNFRDVMYDNEEANRFAFLKKLMIEFSRKLGK
jgi:hypothetical protein